MAKDPDRLATRFDPENSGFISGFLADEDVVDARARWRLGLWGGASVGAVVLAVYASHSSIGFRRDQPPPADLARQEQQLHSIARETQNESRRLASAIDTLNGDRDRLYYRVSALEQGLESMTGAIARQNSLAASPQAAPPPTLAATEPQSPAQTAPPAPVVAPVATITKTPDKAPAETAAAPEQVPAAVLSLVQKSQSPAPPPPASLVAAKSLMAPPDAALTTRKPTQVAAASAKPKRG